MHGSHRHDRIDVDKHIVPLIQSLAAQELPHGDEIRRLDEKHEAMDAAKLGDQGGRRTNDLLPFPACEGSEEVFLNAARFLTRRLLFPMLHDKLDETAERRVEKLLAYSDLLAIKGLVVLLERRLHRIVLGAVALHDDLSWRLAPACAARRLRDEHEAALRRAEIGHIEARIGAEDADRRNARDIMPLGDHLRAEQDVVPLLAKRRENFLVRELSRRRVPVHAHDACCRHERLEFRFQLFRA